MEVIELNVGGRLFATTRSTLCKHAGSMLAAMFSGDMQPALQDSQGRYFIDRNGDWFAIVLSYLRAEPVQFPAFGIQRQALVAEAQYYQLQDLERQLQVGQPSSQGAVQPGEVDFQQTISQLTYHEGHIALCKSAMFILGAEKVQKIGKSLVQVLFFRNKPVANGEQWMTTFSACERQQALTLVHPAELAKEQQEQYSTWEQQQELTKTRFKNAQALAKVVAKLAGISASELFSLLKTYTAVFEQELKERGCQLSQSIFFPPVRHQPVVQWQIAPLM